MARGYVSMGGKAYNGKKAYLVKGKRTYKGKKAYIVKGGKTFLSWSGTEAGEIIVTASGVVTIPEGVTEVDIFCVGGGGGAGGWHSIDVGSGSSYVDRDHYGGGGGGGYTSTELSVPVTPGETLTVVIGAGGKTGNSMYQTSSGTSGSSSGKTDGGDGGQTSVIRDGEVLCSADGGYGGKCSSGSSPYGGDGGDGGSGGCGGGCRINQPSETLSGLSYNGGVDGGDGDPGYLSVSGGSGQGFTTRAFGENNGTLFSNGGDGANNYDKAIPNSGDGANVAIRRDISSSGSVNRYGGSGVAIIRWK